MQKKLYIFVVNVNCLVESEREVKSKRLQKLMDRNQHVFLHNACEMPKIILNHKLSWSKDWINKQFKFAVTFHLLKIVCSIYTQQNSVMNERYIRSTYDVGTVRAIFFTKITKPLCTYQVFREYNSKIITFKASEILWWCKLTSAFQCLLPFVHVYVISCPICIV
jgi:hypothetical protein